VDVKPFIIKRKNDKGMNNPMKGIMKRKGLICLELFSKKFWCKKYILKESCAQIEF
jgi:hypothetical protein